MADEHEIAWDLIEADREMIDEIDQEIIELVRRRAEIAARIARLKRKHKIPIVDGRREVHIFQRYGKALGNLGKTMASAFLSKNKEIPDANSEVTTEVNDPGDRG